MSGRNKERALAPTSKQQTAIPVRNQRGIVQRKGGEGNLAHWCGIDGDTKLGLWIEAQGLQMNHRALHISIYRCHKFDSSIEWLDCCGQFGFDNRADPHISRQWHRSRPADFAVVIGLK